MLFAVLKVAMPRPIFLIFAFILVAGLPRSVTYAAGPPTSVPGFAHVTQGPTHISPGAESCGTACTGGDISYEQTDTFEFYNPEKPTMLVGTIEIHLKYVVSTDSSTGTQYIKSGVIGGCQFLDGDTGWAWRSDTYQPAPTNDGTTAGQYCQGTILDEFNVPVYVAWAKLSGGVNGKFTPSSHLGSL